MNTKILAVITLLFLLVGISSAISQHIKINPDIINKPWNASWITAPDISQNDYGVFHFRKIFELSSKPDKFIIHISGDNRYRFFVNGKSVCVGPAKGDLEHWRFESVDIASHLQAGKNVLASVVWNYGQPSPWSQFTNQTAFILQAEKGNEKLVNTGNSWKVFQNKAYKPIFADNLNIIGPNEEIDAEKYCWNWQSLNFNDADWNEASIIEHGIPAGVEGNSKWKLVPRNIPLMEETIQHLHKVRKQEGIEAHHNFLTGISALEIPANTKAIILLDQGHETTAYPYLSVSGGKGCKITLSYAEALVDSITGNKKNRNLVDGMKMTGVYDIFRPDGEADRLFSTLWFRTFRYIELKIETGEHPVKIKHIYSHFTAYPLKELAQFKSADDTLKEIWNVGWRTARLCANEIYFDCPYYEQLQYTGDTRIQSLISLYVSGDDRLMRNAIELYFNSLNAEGITQSRYPNNHNQIIPGFSLFWTAMIHDYYMHRSDSLFIQKYISGIRQVLAWHEKYIDTTSGMLGKMPYWNFVDWPKEWVWQPTGIFYTSMKGERLEDGGGSPEGTMTGNSSILTLQYVYALDLAAKLFEAFGQQSDAAHYKLISQRLKESTRKLCWSESKGFLADTPERNIFSQHANILAILTDLIPQENQKQVTANIVKDTSLIQATFYYRFYLNRALKKTGLANMYTDILKPWKEMLTLGLTTFAERPEPTRSDCHAWSASPNYDFISLICGIGPGSPGFKTVRIEPALGNLEWIHGHCPHPLGEIIVSFVKHGEKDLIGEVILPKGLSGELVWNNKVIHLKGGRKKIKIFN